MRKVILVIVLCLFAVGITHADSTTLYIPVFQLNLPPDGSGPILEACILNVSTKAREVTTVIVGKGASPLQTVTVILEPGTSWCVTGRGGCEDGCRWHGELVVGGSKSHYLASVNIVDEKITTVGIPAQ
jgi:hypothetical protein